jgi:alkanesulfonate monooxygenase SsuD/methylene tetrahydromethanopterin reductase-like flavin-dependent oxidoreductase (luciferase family)
MFTLRFDMRAPATGASARDLYAAALEMTAWGEAHGCISAIVSEHHASPDGYLPAPLVLASAMAARTRSLPIQVAALIVPLHDPIELAEQMAVLDLVSGGRVSYVVAVGYRPEEYAMFGRDLAHRGRRMDTCLAAMKRAWTGEAFEFEGRPVRVTPLPLTPGGPTLLMGGNTPPAVRRAARLGMGLIAEGGDPSLAALYAAECEKAATTPGLCIVPPGGSVTSAFVAEDPDRAWAEIGPYLLHDAKMYAAWMGRGHTSVSRSDAADVAALRAENGPYRIFTPEEARAHLKAHGLLLMQPLCGGLPPELAWPSLELLAAKVLPGPAPG